MYGLATIFAAAREHGLPPPATAGELGAALARHLYVEGEVVVEDDRVLALTDDDEVQLAYFFLPAQAGEQAPRGGWPTCCMRTSRCPAESTAGVAFAARLEAGTLVPAGGGEGITYAVLLTFYASESIGWLPPLSIQGVRLPGPAGYLRRAVPAGGRYACYSRELAGQERWPDELMALRALVAPGETTIEPALRRCNQYPAVEDRLSTVLTRAHPAAHHSAMAELAAGPRTRAATPNSPHRRSRAHCPDVDALQWPLRLPALGPVRRRMGRRPPGHGRLLDALRR